MGEHERLLPNGLLPNEAASVDGVLDSDGWLKAEERTAELISRIQPNEPSEDRRNAVADYVQRIISKCFPCEVFTFGSVPLKTYLPDGDIDLTAFSKNQNLKETWAHQVRDILEIEEKNENAEFRVKEVQYIQAEVQLIKCLVENIVVDISFNQLGGLCTLCFLEEVDHLINQDHLFKKSIILIKAWCYYESRILGAHHGLISTYALETLVLYIFHVYNNTFAGPLEVLYRFLEFFSKFDWDNFCVSLWGPVPISSLPDVTAEPPRKDSGELLLSKPFLEACSTVYAVGPGLQENHGQHFMSKFFNVVDPLRVNNNLGRSVSKGNFFRIRSAFAFGAKKLARLLDCRKEDINFEVNQFFMNTWDRHGSGQRPDAPRNELWHTRLPTPKLPHRLDNLRNNSNNKTSGSEVQVDVPRGKNPSESTLRSSEVAVVSRSNSQKINPDLNNTKASDQSRRESSASQGVHTEKNQRSLKFDNLVAGEHQGRYLFARTRSSPELTETYGEVSSQGRRNRNQETGKGQISASRLDSRGNNPESENLGIRVIKSSAGDPLSARHFSSRQNLDATTELRSISSSQHDDSGDRLVSALGVQGMHQEEQDFVNIMASSAGFGFNGQVPFPLNQMPYPISPSVLASMGYAPRNFGANIPLIENLWGANMQFPQGLAHFFPGMGMTTNTADSVDPGSETFGSLEASTHEGDHDFWHEPERASTSGLDHEDGGFEMHQTDENHHPSSARHNFVSSSRISGSSKMTQQKFNKDHAEVQLDDRLTGVRSSSSLRSRTSSESSWEGSSAKTSKSSREKRNRKTSSSALPSTVYGKGKNSSEHSPNQIDDENKDWNAMPSMGTEMAERSARPLSASATLRVPKDQLPGFQISHTSGSESLLTLGAPMVLGPNSRQRTADDSGVLPFTFYPAGPPVPFVMLPVYNVPNETGNPDAPTCNFRVEEVVDTSDSGQNFESAERLDRSEVPSTSSTMIRGGANESLEPKSDILHSDFSSHWQNLQYGRLCQSPRYSSPSVYGPSHMVPPVYLQGHFPWDGPGRPLPTNMNVFAQLMTYGPRIVPAAPLQSVSARPAGVYQHYADELPRYRSGTGTYLPNPKVSGRDRHPTNSRKGNYCYDRNEQHGDREGNWGGNSKTRAGGRSHSRSQAEKSSSRLDRLAANENRTDRTWTSQRHHDTYSQNGPVRPNSSQSSSTNVGYHGGVSSSNGPALPVMMLYSYDRRAAGYGVEFGSVGQVGFSGVNEESLSRSEDQRYHHGTSTHHSSPDQPSSPLFHSK